ncbi:glycosyltransferase family 2 protein [Vibrio splendidus]|uniref:glycosyltransferase family 2 protein n=1 Tax=Vibrio splendidus TaxID=29497 RepID=UPI000E32917A|nr:glycosyltransferase family 2 protein [Vibrio splendidus]
MKDATLLSIVIPYFNSSEKCLNLIETLGAIKLQEIEVIFVDDGSNKFEHQQLVGLCDAISIPYQIIKQRNKGPGAARNSGVIASKGEYIWFVDSDDNINLEAIDKLIEVKSENYDFLDFLIEKKGVVSSSMNSHVGEYIRDGRIDFEFGRVVTKIFSKNFIVNFGLFFPEYCIYEDNFFVLIARRHVRKYYCSDVVGYYHNVSCFSVTRTYTEKVNDNYYDRLFTSSLAFRDLSKHLTSPSDKSYLLQKFRSTFFLTTFKHLLSKFQYDEARVLIQAYLYNLSHCLSKEEYKTELNFIDERINSLFYEEKEKISYDSALNINVGSDSISYFKDKRDRHWGNEMTVPVLDMNEKKTLFLHIGTHKTGTTTIQHSLRSNAEDLLEERILYIEAGKLIKKLRFSAKMPESELASIREEVVEQASTYSAAQAYVMSWEGFSGDYINAYENSYNIAHNLHQALSPFFDIKIIVYLRDQASFIESIFTQEVHAGSTTSFNDFKNTIDINKYYWSKLLNSYRSAFGDESVIVMKYEKSESNNLIIGFSEIIGSSHLLNKKTLVNQNVGYNKGELEFAMKVNATLSDDERKKLRKLLQQNSKIQDYSYFSSEEKRKISEFYKEDNESSNVMFEPNYNMVQGQEDNIYTAVARLVLTLNAENEALKSRCESLNDEIKSISSIDCSDINKMKSEIESIVIFREKMQSNINVLSKKNNDLKASIKSTNKRTAKIERKLNSSISRKIVSKLLILLPNKSK